MFSFILDNKNWQKSTVSLFLMVGFFCGINYALAADCSAPQAEVKAAEKALVNCQMMARTAHRSDICPSETDAVQAASARLASCQQTNEGSQGPIEPKPAPTTNSTPAPTTDALKWTPNVSIGSFEQGKAIPVSAGRNILGEYINTWYMFLVGIAGLLAMIMIIMGGITWLTSGGSSGTIGDAKKTISSALIGLTLALLSYVLLQVVNPNLLNLKMPSMANVNFEGDYQIAPWNINGKDVTNPTVQPAVSNQPLIDALNAIDNTPTPMTKTSFMNSMDQSYRSNNPKPPGQEGSGEYEENLNAFTQAASQFYDTNIKPIMDSNPNAIIHTTDITPAMAAQNPNRIFQAYGLSPENYDAQIINSTIPIEIRPANAIEGMQYSTIPFGFNAIAFTPKTGSTDGSGTNNGDITPGQINPNGQSPSTPNPSGAPTPNQTNNTAKSVNGSTTPLNWTPNVSIGSFVQGKAIPVSAGRNILGEYINTWYMFLVGIAGLLAMIMIIMGGITWLTSGGSSGTIGDAKKTISSALIGLTLALLSYVLLQVVNPNLLNLKMPSMANVNFEGDYQIANIVPNSEFSSRAPLSASPTPLSDPQIINKWDPAIQAALARFGLNSKEDLAIIKTIMQMESSGAQYATNAIAGGLMGIRPETARGINSQAGLGYDIPENNNAALSWLMEHPNESLMIAAGLMHEAEAAGRNTPEGIMTWYNSGPSGSHWDNAYATRAPGIFSYWKSQLGL